MAKRPTRKKTEQAANSTASLVNALRFVSLAQRDIGTPNQVHVMLRNNWAVAFDGVLAAGHRIDEDLNACPHTLRMIDALMKCGETLAITHLDTGRLSVRSGAFKALIPCADPLTLPVAFPDPPVGQIDERLLKGFAAVGDLATEGSQHVITSSVLLGPGTVTATNRHLILQYWHGIDLPPGLVLPKAAVTALLKANKPVVKFGFSPSTMTFYFEDESWLRTQLYSEAWPDISHILDVRSNAWPVPEDLFKALAAVSSFSEDGNVFFMSGSMRSHDTDAKGASYELRGIPNNIALNAKLLKMLEPYINAIDLQGVNHVTYFFGENIRGALSQAVRS